MTESLPLSPVASAVQTCLVPVLRLAADVASDAYHEDPDHNDNYTFGCQLSGNGWKRSLEMARSGETPFAPSRNTAEKALLFENRRVMVRSIHPETHLPKNRNVRARARRAPEPSLFKEYDEAPLGEAPDLIVGCVANPEDGLRLVFVGDLRVTSDGNLFWLSREIIFDITEGYEAEPATVSVPDEVVPDVYIEVEPTKVEETPLASVPDEVVPDVYIEVEPTKVEETPSEEKPDAL